MAVSPAPPQLEHVHDNATERSANKSLVLGVETTGKFHLSKWTYIPAMLVALLGLVGNSLVLWLLGFRIRRNRFSVYILNLAAADALYLFCHVVLSILTFVDFPYICFPTFLLSQVTSTSYFVGLSLLAAISTERCLSVLFPVWHRCHQPKHTSAAVCAALWAVANLLGGGEIVFCSYIPSPPICKGVFVFLALWLFLLTCVLCVSSLTLLLRVQCSSEPRQPPRLYRLVLLTVLVFLLCGVAPVINSLISWLTSLHFLPIWLSRLLVCVNSSANPFIYFFLGSQRHRRRSEPLRVILQRALADKQESGGGMRDTPSPTNTQGTSSCD